MNDQRMDERGFKNSLTDKRPSTIGSYVSSVKRFEKWLFGHQKRLGDADKGYFKRYVAHLQNGKKAISTIHTYLRGIAAYYRWWHKEDEAKAIEEIKRGLPRPQPRPYSLSWNEFKDIMEKTRPRINKEKFALLNLLWSEMAPTEIVELHKLDIDFEKQLISTPNGKTYHVTQQAWDALKEFVPNRDGKLFTRTGIRSLEILSQRVLKQTPKQLEQSCEQDLSDTGRKVRFVYKSDRTTSLKEEPKLEKKKDETKKGRLFDRLVHGIPIFGNRVHERIPKFKDERELQLLLEGYLLANFPNELITDEFRFKNDENTYSRMDITVGEDPKIPIEIKVVDKKIRDDKAKGREQVKEFLREYPKSKKGILVIRDRKRDPERIKKHSRTQDSVCIIVI